MQPQGTALINTQYFADLTAEVNAIDVCGELQELVNEAMASLQAEISAIESQIAALIPIIVIPTDLASVIKWITAFVDPQIKVYLNYIAQLAQTVEAIAALAQAIENAAQRLAHCSISVPAIVVTPLPAPIAAVG